jgi:hypothetical protein
MKNKIIFKKATKDDLLSLKKKYRITGAKIGLLCGVDPRTVRKWLSGNYIMPLAVWRLLRILLGEIRKEDVLSEINKGNTDGKMRENLQIYSRKDSKGYEFTSEAWSEGNFVCFEAYKTGLIMKYPFETNAEKNEIFLALGRVVRNRKETCSFNLDLYRDDRDRSNSIAFVK